jgi:hypothetical protein
MRNPHAVQLLAATKAARRLPDRDARERAWAKARLELYVALFRRHHTVLSEASNKRLVELAFAIQAQVVPPGVLL